MCALQLHIKTMNWTPPAPPPPILALLTTPPTVDCARCICTHLSGSIFQCRRGRHCTKTFPGARKKEEESKMICPMLNAWPFHLERETDKMSTAAASEYIQRANLWPQDSKTVAAAYYCMHLACTVNVHSWYLWGAAQTSSNGSMWQK